MQINTNKDYVTTKENSAGELSQIFASKTPDGLKHVLRNNDLVVMKLKDSNGDEISSNTEVVFSTKAPVQKFPRDMDNKSYLPFYTKTLTQQYNNDENEQLKLEIKSGGIIIPEQNELLIHIKSADVIDPANCTIEINGVEELSA